jgi:transcriptional regulator with XRE-family HTH domain
MLVDLAQGDGSLRDLSERSKVSSAYLSLVRSGQVSISIDVYFALLKIAIANECEE